MTFVTLHNDMVFSGTTDVLYGLDYSTGGANWEQHDLPQIYFLTRIQIWEELLYVGAGNTVCFVDPENGALINSIAFSGGTVLDCIINGTVLHVALCGQNADIETDCYEVRAIDLS